MIDRKEIETKLSALTPIHRAATALSIARHVLPFFGARYPDQLPILQDALNKCWDLIQNDTHSLSNELLQKVQSVLPDSETDSEAGPAIPAGEAVLCALATVSEPTTDRLFNAILSAYTAVEMAAYLKEYPTDGSVAVKQAQMEERQDKIRNSPEISKFIALIQRLVDAASRGEQLSSLRRAGEFE